MPSIQARRPTPESKQYEKDEKAERRHILDAMSDFKKIWGTFKPMAEKAKAMFPGRQQIDLDRRKREMVKGLKTDPTLKVYLDQYIGTAQDNRKTDGWRSVIIYQIRDLHLQPGFTLKEALEKVVLYAKQGFLSTEIAKSQAPVRDVLPEALREFLPPNIVVEVDPAGVITRVTDRFGNEHETMERKIERMHLLIRKYNQVAQQVKKDLKSSDERTKLSALVTSIIMETGIRPGKEGNGVVKVINGEDLMIETFGAITLGPEHVKFVRDGFVQLQFPGKKTTENIATLSSKEIIDVLQDYVNKAKVGGNKYIFILRDDTPYTYTDFQRYFRETTALAGIIPTDFRKLKATQTILEGLYDEQQELYRRIKGFASSQKQSLKERIVEEIVATMQRVYEKAQKALSHEDVATTIRAYVNPEIVLRFLSQGKIDSTLSSAILQAKPVLRFDPMTFLAMATGKTAADQLTLESLLEALEADMSADGVSVPRIAKRYSGYQARVYRGLEVPDMSDLRKKLIKLAYEKPELRKHLVPILKTAAEDLREKQIKFAWGLVIAQDVYEDASDIGAFVLRSKPMNDSDMAKVDPSGFKKALEGIKELILRLQKSNPTDTKVQALGVKMFGKLSPIEIALKKKFLNRGHYDDLLDVVISLQKAAKDQIAVLGHAQTVNGAVIVREAEKIIARDAISDDTLADLYDFRREYRHRDRPDVRDFARGVGMSSIVPTEVVHRTFLSKATPQAKAEIGKLTAQEFGVVFEYAGGDY